MVDTSEQKTGQRRFGVKEEGGVAFVKADADPTETAEARARRKERGREAGRGRGDGREGHEQGKRSDRSDRNRSWDKENDYWGNHEDRSAGVDRISGGELLFAEDGPRGRRVATFKREVGNYYNVNTMYCGLLLMTAAINKIVTRKAKGLNYQPLICIVLEHCISQLTALSR